MAVHCVWPSLSSVNAALIASSIPLRSLTLLPPPPPLPPPRAWRCTISKQSGKQAFALAPRSQGMSVAEGGAGRGQAREEDAATVYITGSLIHGEQTVRDPAPPPPSPPPPEPPPPTFSGEARYCCCCCGCCAASEGANCRGGEAGPNAASDCRESMDRARYEGATRCCGCRATEAAQRVTPHSRGGPFPLAAYVQIQGGAFRTPIGSAQK